MDALVYPHAVAARPMVPYRFLRPALMSSGCQSLAIAPPVFSAETGSDPGSFGHNRECSVKGGDKPATGFGRPQIEIGSRGTKSGATY